MNSSNVLFLIWIFRSTRTYTIYIHFNKCVYHLCGFMSYTKNNCNTKMSVSPVKCRICLWLINGRENVPEADSEPLVNEKLPQEVAQSVKEQQV